MPTYKAKRDLWISHECKMVKEGEVFTTEFPKGMKLGTSLELVSDINQKAGKAQDDGKDDGKKLAG